MLTRLLAAALLVPSLAVPAAGQAATVAAPAVWNIDRSHTSVTFHIRHFVSRVRGSFDDVKGTITADADSWQNGTVDIQIATSSIDTGNERRDTHLKSPDFFAADSFPVISFRSTRIERKGDEARIHGNLTMRGVSKPVVLEGKFTGLMKTAQGERVGFEASTTVNRMDFGVKYNRAVEGGGVMLGDEVKVEINVEAVRAKG